MPDAAALPVQAQRVLQRVQRGETAKDIAEALGISRNAVYQQIGKLRRQGHLPPGEGRRQRDTNVSELSVDATVAGFGEQLRSQLAVIGERTRELEKEIKRLREERRKVLETLEVLGLEQPGRIDRRPPPSTEG
jgi:DNA-directed RNA polymerase specialized sigma24 family protein